MTWPRSWLAGMQCSSCLLSHVFSLLFSYPLLSFLGLEAYVSSKFFDKQISSVSTEEFGLPRHAWCVLSRLRCNGHRLMLNFHLSLELAKPRVFLAAPEVNRFRTSLISFCIVCATDFTHFSLFDGSFSLYDIWSSLEELLGFWSSMVSRHAQSHLKNTKSDMRDTWKLKMGPKRK